MVTHADVQVVKVRLNPMDARPNILALVDIIHCGMKHFGIRIVQTRKSIAMEFPELEIGRAHV